MGQVTEAFLTGLSERGDEPPLRKITGSIRIDLHQDGKVENWDLTFDRGKVSVKRGAGGRNHADCELVADSELFDDMVAGRANAMAAVLRGALHVMGDVNKLLLFQRLFPGPPRKTTRGRKP